MRLKKLTLKIVFLFLIYSYDSYGNINYSKDSLLFVAPKHIINGRMLSPLLNLIFIKEDGTKLLGFSYERVLTKRRSLCIVIDGGRTYSKSYTNKGVLSQSNGITLYPEYRFYPFNRKKIYPRGFFVSPSFNIGIYKGWNRLYNTLITTTYNGNSITITESTGYTNSNINYSSNYTSLSLGLGGVFGWQFLLGKQKRFCFSFMAGLYVNKNFTLYESFPIYDDFRMYPQNTVLEHSYIASLLGYSFGSKTKKK